MSLFPYRTATDIAILEYLNQIASQLVLLNLKIKSIMSTQQEIADGLVALTAQVTKIGEESKATIQKVADLEAAIGNQPGVTAELQTAFDALKAQVQVVDDLVPDAPAAPAADAPAV